MTAVADSFEVSGRRIPSLDGLRAVSITFVVLAHLGGTRGFFRTELVHAFGDIGNLGVRIFFVISGYLITTLLLNEQVATGQISLPRFYLRRCFRIFPAAYAFLAVVAVLAFGGFIQATPVDIVCGATYTSNYHRNPSWFVGHLWSLSVEEQFYFVWPAIIVIAGRRRAQVIAIGVVILAPLVRVVTWYVLPGDRDTIGVTFHTVADALATGCILACFRDRLSRCNQYVRCMSLLRFWHLPAVLVVVLALNAYTPLDKPVGQTMLNLFIALWIDRCIRIPDDVFGRFLNSKPVISVGVLSYSLYLWQQPFLNRASASGITSFPCNVLLALGGALLSYRFVERPCLEMRLRIEKRIFRNRDASRSKDATINALRTAVLDSTHTEKAVGA